MEIDKTKIKTVKCRYCSKDVTVTLISFGSGCVGICPLCGLAAYNGA